VSRHLPQVVVIVTVASPLHLKSTPISTSQHSRRIFRPPFVIVGISTSRPVLERTEVSAGMNIVEIRHHPLSVIDPVFLDRGHVPETHHALAEGVNAVLCCASR
jgi:hypothetical protein